MDTQPGQILIPHDNDSNSNGPQPPANTAQQPVQPVEQSATPPTTYAESPNAAVNTVPGAMAQDLPAQEAIPANYVDKSYLLEDDDWRYDGGLDASTSVAPLPEDVDWTASEFIEHPKSMGWYGLLALAALGLGALDYFVTKDPISTSVIIFAAALFGVYAGRKPHTRQYHLSPQGLQIGEKLYSFHIFKAFSVTEEGAIASIVFAPLGRFAPPLTIYVAPEMEEKVLDYLSTFLPIEQHRADAVDGLLRRIRF